MAARAASAVRMATPTAIAPTATSAPLVGARAERHDEERGAGDERERDGDECGSAAGERGFGSGRVGG